MPARGFTLLELAVVLFLLSLTLGHLLSAGRRQVDRLAVLGAREEVVGLLHRARMEAVANGGASVRLFTDPPRVELEAKGMILERRELEREYGIDLGLTRDRKEVELRFGPLGIGHVSGQTLRFRRGTKTAELVISSLGRVSRP